MKNGNHTIEKWVITGTFAIGLFVLLSWIYQIYFVFDIKPQSATTKFNTALCFILVSLAIYNQNRTSKLQNITYLISCVSALIIGFLSFSEYLFDFSISIDNLIVNDTFSPGISGRMSPATAICFILMSSGLLINLTYSSFLQRIRHHLYLLVLIISFTSIVSHMLAVPIENKLGFFQTMSLLTSTLFLALSLTQLVKKPNYKFGEFISGKFAGSRLIRIMFPFVLIMPLLLNYFLLFTYNHDWIKIDFGIVLGTVIYILISICYLAIVGIDLNKSDIARSKLEAELAHHKQEELKINLLRETHHRVKNNFQMVNSMLRLQSLKVDNEKLKSVMEDCQDRIRAVASIHESMYLNGNFETVEVAAFFKSIIDSLLSSYSEGKKIEVDYKVDPEYLNMSLAIPISLIINEAVTNSLKHAFTKNQNALITLHLNELSKKSFELIIGDNGTGMSDIKAPISEEDKTMGLDLIESFAEQLSGKIERLNVQGVVYRIAFEER